MKVIVFFASWSTEVELYRFGIIRKAKMPKSDKLKTLRRLVPKDRCKICGNHIHVMCFKGTDVCSEGCRKRLNYYIQKENDNAQA